MVQRRVETDRLLELIRLHRMSSSAREVARLLRMGPNTERRYRDALASAGLLHGSPQDLPTLDAVKAAVQRPAPRAPLPLDRWRSTVEALFDKGLTARAVFDRLRLDTKIDETPFQGSYSGIKRLARQIRLKCGARAEDVAVPVETAPGEAAQVDFGYAGRLYDPARGVLRRAWVFVMVLCHSRLMFVEVVFDQRIETWLRLHEQAFAAFGGSVETVIPDNTRRAVLRAAFALDGPTELNRSYRELARHYGFKIDPAPPGSPRKKGKVEAAVKYINGNGLKGRAGEPMDVVQAALQRWNREIASTRVHGSTGRRPIEVFEREERTTLRPLPATPYELAIWRKARVHPDCHVVFRDRLYSVPWRLVNDEVWIRGGRVVEIFHHDEPVATHDRFGPRRSTIEEHLPPDRRDLRHRGRAFWEARAARIGTQTLALVATLFDSDEVLSTLRQVQAVVRHLEQYPVSRAEATCRLARLRGDHSYRGVKQILALALDRVAMPVPPIDPSARPCARQVASSLP